MRYPVGAERAAAWLGGLGLVPFAGFALFAWWSGPSAERLVALQALTTWGAVILGFMAGARWAMILQARAGAPLLRLAAVGMAPPILALIAPVVSPRAGLAMLTLGFVGLLIFELSDASRAEAPAWYPRLRIPLSCGAICCLVLGAALG